jgi:general secretion pathway protein D
MAMGAIKIVADEKNNSLLMLATREDYQKLQSLIRQLDVMPMQVLVEATIVEVRLGDELSYGLQWFFSHQQGSTDSTFELFPNGVSPTFRYTLVDTGGDFKAVLDLLAADGRLGVLSSPSLMVQDNQMASIHVGQQIPIRTSETTSLASSGDSPLITSTIQYRDTGVLLEVKPRVNSGGMISMEITQQVDGVDETTTSSIDSPTIFQRKITTNIAVQSGETIVLGGLITESESASNTGIPVLRGLPGIGPLFSSQKNEVQRTELMIMITPTSISNSTEARSATEEMKKKMLNLFEE